MGSVSKSAATLRIFGDDLVPEEITSLLGCEPTSAAKKGDAIIGSNADITRRTGRWNLDAIDCEPEDLDAQVSWLLAQLNDDVAVWRSITTRFRVDLFCGLFMNSGDEGLTVAPSTLIALGSRGIEIGLCLYPPDHKGAGND
jgi:hypothetical protein